MSAFKSIKQGLTEAVAHAKGNRSSQRIPALRSQRGWLAQALGIDARAVRRRFGFSVATLRHWERGDRTPHGPALVLLNLIDREPKAVLRALAA